jgi:hypothetical protein
MVVPEVPSSAVGSMPWAVEIDLYVSFPGIWQARWHSCGSIIIQYAVWFDAGRVTVTVVGVAPQQVFSWPGPSDGRARPREHSVLSTQAAVLQLANL